MFKNFYILKVFMDKSVEKSLATLKASNKGKHFLPRLLAIIIFAWSAYWLLWNALTFSIVSDETVYIPAGVRMLLRGDMVINNEHPPLNKILSGVFVLPLKPNIDTAINEAPDNNQWKMGTIFFHESGNPTKLIVFLGRLPTVILTLTMLYSVFRWMTCRWHIWAGVGSLAALALNPNIIAHGALTTNDIHLVVAVWFLFIATYNLAQEPQKLTRYVWWGSACGLVLLAKFSGFFFVALSMVSLFVFLVVKKEKILPFVLRFFLSLFVCLFLVWLSYVLIEHRALLGKRTVDASLFQVRMVQISNPVIKTLVVPFLRYAEGYNVVYHHNIGGHRSYLNGEFSDFGFRQFFVYAIYYKTPTALLVLLAGGLFLAIRKRQGVILLMSFFAVLYVFCASLGRIHIGIRHILPFYLLTAPAIGYLAWKMIATRKIMVYSLLALFSIWLIVDLACNSPNRISYFSQLSGGWKNGYKYLSDSNTDWGQEAYLLAEYAKEHPDSRLIIGYIVGADSLYRSVAHVKLSEMAGDDVCSKLEDGDVLIVSVNIANSHFGRYPCISHNTHIAERLGHTFLLFYPQDFKANNSV